ncbi:hypothetical protein FUB07_10560 [Vibrio cholerae]|nr:hypothetical protein [Vibrio cholerae]
MLMGIHSLAAYLQLQLVWGHFQLSHPRTAVAVRGKQEIKHGIMGRKIYPSGRQSVQSIQRFLTF